MTLLRIYKLDLEGDPVSELKEGEHVIGRGTLLQCDDRRVSRNHGVIKITEDEATLTSTHVNPCFYQGAASTTIIILKQGNPMSLVDGDKFALLADKYWFKIGLGSTKVLPKDKETDKSLCVTKRSFEENSSPTCSKKLKTEGDETNILNVSNEIDNTNNETAKKLKKVLLDLHAESSCTFSKQESQQYSKPQIKYKSSLSRHVDSSSHDAKLRDILFSSDEDDIVPAENSKGNNVSIQNIDVNFLTSSTRREVLSDSDGGAPAELKTSTPAKDNNVGIKNIDVKLLPSSTKRKVLSDSDDDAPAELKTSQPARDNNVGIKNIDVNLLPSSTRREVLSDSDDDATTELKTSTPADTNIVETTGDNKVSDSVDEESNTKQESSNNIQDPSCSTDDTNKPGPSDTNKKIHRDRCWYGIQCYRKNKDHLSEYSHPGDSDFDSDPDDERPICDFGADCYRRNKGHREAYKHPKNVKKPPGTKHKGTPKKRKRAKPKYNDTPEDDYDLDDPFIDDSGTEYETESDSDDSDSDWSEASEGGTKRLLKEAKRFTKDKKKDENDD